VKAIRDLIRCGLLEELPNGSILLDGYPLAGGYWSAKPWGRGFVIAPGSRLELVRSQFGQVVEDTLMVGTTCLTIQTGVLPEHPNS
jgi:hypothetical protein